MRKFLKYTTRKFICINEIEYIVRNDDDDDGEWA